MRTRIVACMLVALAGSLPCLASDGAELWTNLCAKCHGADGKGRTTMGRKLKLRDLGDAKVQAELTDEAIRDTIRNGRKSPSGSTLMKPAEGVTDEDIGALVLQVRKLKA